MTQPPAAQAKPPPWWRSLRADPPFLIRIALGAGFVGVLLLLWWLVTRGADPIVSRARLASPGEVLDAFGRIFDQNFGHHVFMTLKRVFKGIVWAALVGITLGVLAGSYRAVSAALMPMNVFLRSVPMAAMVPIVFLIVKGGGERQKEVFIFLAVVAFVFSDTLKAISSVPQRYVETAETLGASRWQIIRKVLFPLALPDIITSLRFQFGLAFGYIMLVEPIDADGGLGLLLDSGRKRFLIEQSFALLIVIALLAFVIDFAIRWLQRGVFPYRKDL